MNCRTVAFDQFQQSEWINAGVQQASFNAAVRITNGNGHQAATIWPGLANHGPHVAGARNKRRLDRRQQLLLVTGVTQEQMAKMEREMANLRKRPVTTLLTRGW